MKRKPRQDQPARPAASPEQKYSAHDGRNPDEHDGKSPAVEGILDEVVGETEQTHSDEQPTNDDDLEGTFHGIERDRVGYFGFPSENQSANLAASHRWLFVLLCVHLARPSSELTTSSSRVWALMDGNGERECLTS